MKCCRRCMPWPTPLHAQMLTAPWKACFLDRAWRCCCHAIRSKVCRAPPLPIKVEHQAMQAIGKAIEREMESTNTKLMTLHAPGAEVVVYQPAMRDAVLLGTRTTLLNA